MIVQPPRASSSGPPDLAVLIALSEEFELLREFVDALQPVANDEYGADDYFFEVPTESGPAYRCVTTFIGDMGIDQAVQWTNRLMTWRPRAFVNVGIAGTLKPSVLKLGDVFVARLVDCYATKGKVEDNADHSGWELSWGGAPFPAHAEFVKLAEQLEYSYPAIHDAWRRAAREDIAARGVSAERLDQLRRAGVMRDAPAIASGDLASGPFLQASSRFVAKLWERNRKLTACEMEAGGMLLATHHRRLPIPTMVIRGISDLADADPSKPSKAELDAIGDGALRRHAMANALGVFFALLRAGRLLRTPPSARQRPSTAPRAGVATSTSDLVEYIVHDEFDVEPPSRRPSTDELVAVLDEAVSRAGHRSQLLAGPALATLEPDLRAEWTSMIRQNLWRIAGREPKRALLNAVGDSVFVDVARAWSRQDQTGLPWFERVNTSEHDWGCAMRWRVLYQMVSATRMPMGAPFCLVLGTYDGWVFFCARDHPLPTASFNLESSVVAILEGDEHNLVVCTRRRVCVMHFDREWKIARSMAAESETFTTLRTDTERGLMYVGATTGAVGCWDMNLRRVWRTQLGTAGITSMAWASEGSIVVGLRDGHVRVLSVETGSTTSEVLAHSEGTVQVGFSEPANIIVTVGVDGLLKSFDATELRRIATAQLSNTDLSEYARLGLSIEPDGRRVVVSELSNIGQGAITVWGMRPETSPQRIEHEGAISGLRFIANGFMLVWGKLGTWLYDVDQLDAMSLLSSIGTEHVGLHFPEDSDEGVVVVVGHHVVELRDIKAEAVISDAYHGLDWRFQPLMFAADGSLWIMSCLLEAPYVTRYSIGGTVLPSESIQAKDNIWSSTMLTDGRHVVCVVGPSNPVGRGPEPKRLVIVDVVARAVCMQIDGVDPYVHENAGDGRLLISRDKTLEMWSMATGSMLRSFGDIDGDVAIVRADAEHGQAFVACDGGGLWIAYFDGTKSAKVGDCPGSTSGIIVLSRWLGLARAKDGGVKVWRISGGIGEGSAIRSDDVKYETYVADGKQRIYCYASFGKFFDVWKSGSNAKMLRRFGPHPSRILGLLPLRGSAFIISVCEHDVRVWEVGTGECWLHWDSPRQISNAGVHEDNGARLVLLCECEIVVLDLHLGVASGS